MLIRFHQQSSQLEWNESLPPQWGSGSPNGLTEGVPVDGCSVFRTLPKIKDFCQLPQRGSQDALATIHDQLTHLLRSVDMHFKEKPRRCSRMQAVPDKETLDDIAELFKGFADSTRVHILSLLAVE